MKAIQTTFCTLPFLEEVIKCRKKSRPHNVAYKILYNLSDIKLDIDSEELRKRILDKEQNPIYNILSKREGKEFESSVNWRNTINFSDVRDELFFISTNYIPDYKALRNQNGALIIANDANLHELTRLNDKQGKIFLIPKDKKSIKEDEKIRVEELEGIYQDSWDKVLNTYPMTPTNSLIISDNYLGENLIKSKKRGLLDIIKTVLPKDLNIPFDIVIFTTVENENTFPRQKAVDLITEIKHLFPNEEDVRVTIVAHTETITTHMRTIISNYHFLQCDRGFGTILDEKKSYEPSIGSIESVFHSIESTHELQPGTKHIHYQYIEWLKLIFHGKKGMDATYSYIVGDKTHRLLDL